MYLKTADNKLVISLADWIAAGNTKRQYRQDAERGAIKIASRGWRGASTIYVDSIQRPDRLEKIERHLGAIEDAIEKYDRILRQMAEVARVQNERWGHIDARMERLERVLTSFVQTGQSVRAGDAAQAGHVAPVAPDVRQAASGEGHKIWPDPVRSQAVIDSLLSWRSKDGKRKPLLPEQVTRYANRAAIFEACRVNLERLHQTRAKGSTRVKMEEWYKEATHFYTVQAATVEMTADPITNARHFERKYRQFVAARDHGDWLLMLPGTIGNRAARKVTKDMIRLWTSLYNDNSKPFVEEVHERYSRFLAGENEIFDRATGEVITPDPDRYKKVSKATLYNALKAADSAGATVRTREGTFRERNGHLPLHSRKEGEYSLSKITMDDLTLSRRSHKGQVNAYVYTDVMSGYVFPAAYRDGPVDRQSVEEAHRNMMRELLSLGLPKPGESSNEYHLIKDIDWWPQFWDRVHYNTSAPGKEQEHFNRQMKYGVKKRLRQIKMRHYGRGAYQGQGQDEKTQKDQRWDFAVLCADDERARREWNNAEHPRFPGKTRRQVLIENANPNLKPIQPWYHFRMFCPGVRTSIVNNYRITVNNQEFWLQDPESLLRLAPNRRSVEACFLTPDELGGSVDKIYLYQGEKYIGEAFDIAPFRYNKQRCEWQAGDGNEEKFLFQNKYVAHFRKFVQEWRKDLLIKVGELAPGLLDESQNEICDPQLDATGSHPDADAGNCRKTGASRHPDADAGNCRKTATGSHPDADASSHPDADASNCRKTGTGHHPDADAGSCRKTGTGRHPDTSAGSCRKTGTSSNPDADAGNCRKTGTSSRRKAAGSGTASQDDPLKRDARYYEQIFMEAAPPEASGNAPAATPDDDGGGEIDYNQPFDFDGYDYRAFAIDNI